MSDLSDPLPLTLLSAEQFKALPDYSCTLPTGVVIGKQWKRRKFYTDPSQGWLMGEYVRCDEDAYSVQWSEIVVADWTGGYELDPPVPAHKRVVRLDLFTVCPYGYWRPVRFGDKFTPRALCGKDGRLGKCQVYYEGHCPHDFPEEAD